MVRTNNTGESKVQLKTSRKWQSIEKTNRENHFAATKNE